MDMVELNYRVKLSKNIKLRYAQKSKILKYHQ